MATNEDLAELLFPDVTKTIEDLEREYPLRNLPEGAQVTRFAPSPTGFLHTGSLFTSMISYTYAKQIIAGDCLTPLSEEEHQAIKAARDNSSNIIFKERMMISKRKRELLRLKATKKGAKENV